MRITESTIRRIIREEACQVLRETITRDGTSDAMRYFMSKEEPAVEQPDVDPVVVSSIKDGIIKRLRARNSFIIRYLKEISEEGRILSNPDYTDLLIEIAEMLELDDYTYVDIDAALKEALLVYLNQERRTP